MQKKCYNILLGLNTLSIYRNLLDDKIIINLKKLLESIISNSEIKDTMYFYGELLYNTNKEGSFVEYMAKKVILDENPFTIAAEKYGRGINEEILKAAKYDLWILGQIVSFDFESLLKYILIISENKIINDSFTDMPLLPNKVYNKNLEYSFLFENYHWHEIIEEFIEFHSKKGAGKFCTNSTFVWSGDTFGIVKVSNSEDILLKNLIGYENQKEIILENTENFINGYPANNILLYGDRGTGKSSTVKALAKLYENKGLRIVEVYKNMINDFPKLISLLSKRNFKFIIFIDDIAFENNEESYTAMKALLEGSVESKPSNMLIYATSNRKHLIKETFKDRQGLYSDNIEEEIHSRDNIQEKLSLSDRFGIRVIFPSTDQKEYLNIVEQLALRRGLSIEKQILFEEAIRWEMRFNGLSPRTAKQFVDYIEGRCKK